VVSLGVAWQRLPTVQISQLPCSMAPALAGGRPSHIKSSRPQSLAIACLLALSVHHWLVLIVCRLTQSRLLTTPLAALTRSVASVSSRSITKISVLSRHLRVTNGASSSTKEGSVFLCRRCVCYTVVSARVHPRSHGVHVNMDRAFFVTAP
jgi:hypothetical protein